MPLISAVRYSSSLVSTTVRCVRGLASSAAVRSSSSLSSVSSTSSSSSSSSSVGGGGDNSNGPSSSPSPTLSSIYKNIQSNGGETDSMLNCMMACARSSTWK